MNNKNFEKETIENLEKDIFFDYRLHENLFQIEIILKKIIGKMKSCTFQDSSVYFNEIEELKIIVSKVYYNKYKIEIADLPFHFMTTFKRIDVERERYRLWIMILKEEYKFN